MLALKNLDEYIKKIPGIEAIQTPKEYMVVDIETIPGLPSNDTLLYFQEKRWGKKQPKEKKPKKNATPEDIDKLNQKLNEDVQAYHDLIHSDMSIEPSLNAVCCVTLRTAAWLRTWVGKDEIDILNKFWVTMNALRQIQSGLQLVTFNGLGFDFPVLETRSAILSIPHFELPKQRYRTDKHFDVRMVLANWDKFALGDLHFWADVFKIKAVKNVIKSDEIYEYYKNNDMQAIKKHCEEDTRLTKEIYLKLQ